MKKVLFSLDIRTWPPVTGGQWVRMGGLEDQESKTAGEEPGGPLGFLVSSSAKVPGKAWLTES